MIRTVSVAGVLVLAVLLYLSLQSIGSVAQTTALPQRAEINAPIEAVTQAPDPLEDLAAWPAAAGR